MFMSCRVKDYTFENEFISKYENHDFSFFSLTELKLRGNRDNQKLISLRKFDSINKELFYKTFVLDSNKNLKYYPEKYFIGETPNIYENKVVRKFDSIDVSYLNVDKDFNVKININNYEDFNLVRINDSIKYFKNKRLSNYVKIKNNWYYFRSR